MIALGVTAPGSPDALEVRVSLVIPAKNEERNIAWVLQRVPTFVDEVVLVDGHSTDRTVEIARAVRPDIRVVTESARGKGSAVRTGFAAANGSVVVMLDADGSMDPEEIRAYVTAVTNGADVVKGSRFLPGGGTTDITFVRNLGNRALLKLVNLLYGSRFSELCYGYMAVRRSCVGVLDLSATGFEIETEIVVRALRSGLRVVEVPSFESPRRYGSSNLNAARDGLRIFRTLIVHRWRGRVAAPESPSLLHELSRHGNGAASFPMHEPTLAFVEIEADDEGIRSRDKVRVA